MSLKTITSAATTDTKHKKQLATVKKTPSKGKVSKESKTGVEHKKPHRFRPGTVANREIRKYQKSTDLLVPKVAVLRLVKQILADQGFPELRLGKKALALLQLALEDEILKQMQIAREAAQHAGRITIQPKDIHHANRIRDTHPGTTYPNGGSGGVVMPMLYQENHHHSSSKRTKKASSSKSTDASSVTTTHETHEDDHE